MEDIFNMKIQQLAVSDNRADKRIKLIYHPCPGLIADEIFWDLNEETGQSQIKLLFTLYYCIDLTFTVYI